MSQTQREFYATATNRDGAHLIINNLPEGRLQAENAVVRHCKKNKLTFQGVHLVKGSGRQNSTLTKTMEAKRGRKVYF